MTLLMFFVIGVVEMFIVAWWTKAVSASQVLVSGVVTFVNILIYFWVLEAVLSSVNNTPIIMTYALGCAIGTMIAASKTFERLLQRRQFSPIAHEANTVV